MGWMIPIRYGSFWDVPRAILLHYRGKSLLLESPFDEDLDEYSGRYEVYQLPDETDWAMEPRGPWIADEVPRSLIGHILVSEVVFDSTMREALDPACLDALLNG